MSNNKTVAIYEYSGAIHIHTTDSDGTGTHKQIISIARQLGVDFLMFSDHMTLKSLHREGWYGELLVVVGYEINDPDNKNHYLAFGLKETLPDSLYAKDYVQLVRKMGGFGIIAHPDEKRHLPDYPPYPWTEWGTDEFDGIEIWNHISSWLESINKWNRFLFFVKPRSSLTRPTDNILLLWDRLNRTRRVVGVASLDAHAFRYRMGLLKFTIFPYKIDLLSLRTVVLLRSPLSKDFNEAKRQLFCALGGCQAYFCNLRWGDPSNFFFIARTEKKGDFIIGEEVPIEEKPVLLASVPKIAELRLIKDGEMILSSISTSFEYRATSTGIFRLEALIDDKGWIYTNHIRIV